MIPASPEWRTRQSFAIPRSHHCTFSQCELRFNMHSWNLCVPVRAPFWCSGFIHRVGQVRTCCLLFDIDWIRFLSMPFRTLRWIYQQKTAKFQVITVVVLKSAAFWHITQGRLVDSYRRLEESYGFDLQGSLFTINATLQILHFTHTITHYAFRNIHTQQRIFL